MCSQLFAFQKVSIASRTLFNILVEESSGDTRCRQLKGEIQQLKEELEKEKKKAAAVYVSDWKRKNSPVKAARKAVRELLTSDIEVREAVIDEISRQYVRILIGDSKEAQLFRFLSRMIPEDLYNQIRGSSPLLLALPAKRTIHSRIDNDLENFEREHNLEIQMLENGDGASFSDLRCVFAAMRSCFGIEDKVVPVILSHDASKGGVVTASVFIRVPVVAHTQFPNSSSLGIPYAVCKGSDSASNIKYAFADKLNSVLKESTSRLRDKNYFKWLRYDHVLYLPKLLLDYAALRSSVKGDPNPPGYSLSHSWGHVQTSSISDFEKAKIGDEVKLFFTKKSGGQLAADGDDDGDDSTGKGGKYVSLMVKKCSLTINDVEYIYADCRGKREDRKFRGVLCVDFDQISLDWLLHGAKRLTGSLLNRMLKRRIDAKKFDVLDRVDVVMSEVLDVVWCWKDSVSGTGKNQYVRISLESAEDSLIREKMESVLKAFSASDAEQNYGKKLVELLKVLHDGPVVDGDHIDVDTVETAVDEYLKNVDELATQMVVLRQAEAGMFVGGVYDHLFFCHLAEMERKGISDGGLIANVMNMEGIEALNGKVMRYYRHHTSKNETASLGGSLPVRTEEVVRNAVKVGGANAVESWEKSPPGVSFKGRVEEMTLAELKKEASNLNVANVGKKNKLQLKRAVETAKRRDVKFGGKANIVKKKGLWTQAMNNNRFVQVLKLVEGDLCVIQL